MNTQAILADIASSGVDVPTASMASPVSGTDLKTMLRRLYVSLGGNRGTGGYDPSASELRDVWKAYVQRGQQDGEREVAALMAKAGASANNAAGRAGSYTPPEAVADVPAAEPVASPSPLKASKPADTSDAASQLAAAIAAIAGQQKQELDPEAVAAMVDAKIGDRLDQLPQLVEQAVASAVRRVEIVVPAAPAVTIDKAHAQLETVLKACVAGVSPFLVGPAGSGKTTLASQIAKALNRPFFMQARITSEYKLTGFIDANGKAVQTDFRRAWEQGGVFLFDEVDASDADAVTAFNAPLANRICDFPDGQVEAHPDFIAIAAGNTYGRGADREYVGRQQLDAATLDRFSVFDVDYDEALELAIAGNDDWTRYVQKVRAAVAKEKVRAIVSPRASINGAKLLAAGLDRQTVEEATIWKGMDETQRNRITAAMRYA